MDPTAPNPAHARFMRLALEEAAKCEPTPTAFCVGSIIASGSSSADHSRVLATGYSRELPGNTHAEQCALDKLPAGSGEGLDLYTTLEPCSTRLSGNVPCVDRILALPKGTIARVLMGVEEPDDFVACEGTRKLRDAGVEVVTVAGFADECLKAARRGHPGQT